ncbi:MAG TPA: glycosyltransferase family 2 protein, partial [Candidatus Edwardsbacteria bacterium]|nr:glycosyltransferase family 2 protein [Candidatus Edwardsbacteria bacterium]
PSWATSRFPQIHVVRSDANLGYAGGCNLGIRATSEEYVVLLNNDTELEPGWLGHLVAALDADRAVAAAQPKILWLKDRTKLDYSGGAGGLMDRYGFPYCRGRLFETLETDNGQYDGAAPDIFWASGSASIYRRAALDAVGPLDEDFFMHMEEIDLCWRMHLAGWRVVAAPRSVVYHLSGGSLPAGNFRKLYLNHRNSQLMLWKNYSLGTLAWVWPARLALELSALGKALASRDWDWARAIVQALRWMAGHPAAVWRKHRAVQALRRVPDSAIAATMHRGSIALAYFLRGARTARELE